MSPTETAEISEDHIAVIEPATGWRMLDGKELSAYRDLFFFLVFQGTIAIVENNA